MKLLKITKLGLAIGVLAIIFSFVPFLGQKNTLAASVPHLKEVHGRQVTKLKLPIKYEKYAGKKVRIKLYTTNVYTGEERVTHHNRKLDNQGKVTLRVDNLKPGTLYRFKVRIKRQSGGHYSSKSAGRKGSTRFYERYGRRSYSRHYSRSNSRHHSRFDSKYHRRSRW